jgi:crossover junction endodeoxyribonuclease RuvC
MGILYAMRLLALDPALRNSGFAVLENQGGKIVALHFGALKNRPDLSFAGCLVSIHTYICDLVTEYRPEACAVEGIIYAQNTRTAITLGAARGAAILAAAQAGLTVYEYPPKRVKQAVVGHGAAQKAQVAFMVRALLGLTEMPGPDAADAIAIGLTHFQMQASPIQRIGKSSRL